MIAYLAPVLGVLAGVVGVLDTIPYIRATVRGTTRPHRGHLAHLGALAIVVVAADLSLLLYPAHFCLVNGAIAVLIGQRRHALTGRLGWVDPVRTG